ncbi:MAG: DUF6065 family protein [bacterium]
MEVNLIRNHQNPPEIRQSRPRRDWMDESYKKHAYKCLPLTSANTHGWEVILQQDVTVVLDSPIDIPRVVDGQIITHTMALGPTSVPEVQPEPEPEPEPEPDRRWDGDPPNIWSDEKNREHLQQLEPEPEPAEVSYERDLGMPSIIGIISLAVDWVMNPPEGYSTMISGPPNYFMKDAVPLTAIIPGWWPDPFAMNWKITKCNTPVTFPKGMPYMWFTFVKDDFLPDIRFNVGNTWDHEELMEQRQAYGEEKTRKEIEEPWTWVGGIRTGLTVEGERAGPKFEGHPVLDVPTWEN